MDKQIREIYDARCGSEDKCNCFLHSYTVPGKPSRDTFKDLQPFVDYVTENHTERQLTLCELKEYARDFRSEKLSFDLTRLK